MIIRLDRFGGLIPRAHQKTLPPNNAQRADNCRLLSGALGAWQSRQQVCALENPATVNTIYLFNHEHWLSWPQVVDVTRGAIGGDVTERTYFTGGPEGRPQVIDTNTALGGNEPFWSPSRFYNSGDYVVPTAGNGLRYEALQAGITGQQEPVWPSVGSTVPDGGAGGVAWIGRHFADYAPPSEQASPAICWMLPERSYHLGVPRPAAAPVATRTVPTASVLSVSSFANVESGEFLNRLDNVVHDGTTQITVRATVESGIQIVTSQTGTVTYVLSRIDPLGTATVLQTVVVNVEGTGSPGEPGVIFETPIGDFILPMRTLEVTEVRPPGLYSYRLSAATTINPDPSIFGTLTHFYSWSTAAGTVLSGVEVEVGPDHPFAVGDRIIIFGVVGINALNAEHAVLDVGPTSVFIVFPAGVEVDAGDYVSGGTWQHLPSIANSIDRVYVYTFIAIMGGKHQEGQPSPPSAIISLRPGDPVTLTGMSLPPDGYNVSRMRIYRTVDGETNATYKFIAEQPVATSHVDTVPEDSPQIGEEVPSITWSPPPQNLTNITEMPGGILAGTSGNEVLFCEPYQPHAWPLEYRKAVTGEPVALGAFGNSLAVLTDSFPYLITGTHPDSMSIDKLELAWACVSKRSVVDMGYSIVYACPDGLVSVGPGQLELVTRGLFSEREWQALNPESIMAARYDSAYVFFYDNGITRGGYLFNPREPLATLTQLSFFASAAHTDNRSGTLYLAVDGNLVAFNTAHAARESYVWRSKRFVTTSAINFSAAQVKADGYPVAFALYSAAEGALRRRFFRLVMNDDPFRLPGGYRSGEWEIELSGDRDVTAVFLAETVQELRNA